MLRKMRLKQNYDFLIKKRILEQKTNLSLMKNYLKRKVL